MIMNKHITRRDWLNRSAAVLGGTLLSSVTGYNPLYSTPISWSTNEPIRMMYNENPYGPSQIARKAMQKAFSESNLYSMTPAKAEFKALIAKLNGVKPSQVVIGFGSTEILKKAALMNGIDGGELVSPTLTFEEINHYADTLNMSIKRVPMDNKIGIDLNKISDSVSRKTKLVYLCNPNNPTGKIMDSGELESFCKNISKRTVVFIDEAYLEYVSDPDYRSMLGLVKKGINVIVSRTASKVHGLAGLRVGYAITTTELAKKLESYLTDYLNIVGLRAAIASYQDQEFQNYSIKMNDRAKRIVTNFLDEKGIQYLDSHSNFIFFHIGKPITEFQPAMEKKGVLVGRPFPPYTDWCRLSMATPDEMGRFIEGFNALL